MMQDTPPSLTVEVREYSDSLFDRTWRSLEIPSDHALYPVVHYLVREQQTFRRMVVHNEKCGTKVFIRSLVARTPFKRLILPQGEEKEAIRARLHRLLVDECTFTKGSPYYAGLYLSSNIPHETPYLGVRTHSPLCTCVLRQEI